MAVAHGNDPAQDAAIGVCLDLAANFLKSAADLAPVTDKTRGSAIRARLVALNLSDREFHARTGIDRKTLSRAVADDEGVRRSTYAAIHSGLDELEAVFFRAPAPDVEVPRGAAEPDLTVTAADQVYTTAEVAERFRCTPTTVIRIATEIGAGVNLGGHDGYRFKESDVKAMWDSRRMPKIVR